MAPAAVYVVGVTFTLRDLVHDRYGPQTVFGLILAGAALSAAISPSFAVASGAAFLLAETADLLVYTPLRRRGLVRAVVASNAVGLAVDSALFLHLAFGTLEYLPGQIVGKALMTAAVLPFLWRRRVTLAAA